MDTKKVTTTETVEDATVSQSSAPATRRTVTTKVGSGSIGEFFISKTNQVIFTFAAIIDLLIALRFAFLLLGANRVGFVTFIINLTEIFVAPAKGIFPATVAEGGYFEPASIVAIFMWLIFAFIVATIIKLFSSDTSGEDTVV